MRFYSIVDFEMFRSVLLACYGVKPQNQPKNRGVVPNVYHSVYHQTKHFPRFSKITVYRIPKLQDLNKLSSRLVEGGLERTSGHV